MDLNARLIFTPLSTVSQLPALLHLETPDYTQEYHNLYFMDIDIQYMFLVLWLDAERSYFHSIPIANLEM